MKSLIDERQGDGIKNFIMVYPIDISLIHN